MGFEVGGGKVDKDVCGLALDTGGKGAANIGGGKLCIPSGGTDGGVGLGTEVAIAGDNCDDALLLKIKKIFKLLS